MPVMKKGWTTPVTAAKTPMPPAPCVITKSTSTAATKNTLPETSIIVTPPTTTGSKGIGLAAKKLDQQAAAFEDNSLMANYPLDAIFLPMKANKTQNSEKMAKLWSSDEYICDEKVDGHRMYSVGGRLFSRHLSDITGMPVEKTGLVPHIAKALERWPLLMLDGEAYLPGQKSEDVQEIMGCGAAEAVARQEQRHEYMLYRVFDIVRAPDGTWLTNKPWHQRHKILVEFYITYLNNKCPYIELGQIIRENKFEYCQEIWKQGGEGIILKNINGLYLPDKRPMWNWMKVKQDFDDDVFIVGFMPPTKEYDGNTPLGLWQYWETERGLIVSDPDGAPAIPVTKYYAMGWIGSIIIGQYRPLNASVGIPIPGMQNYSSKGQTWVPVEVGSVSGMRERDRAMFSKDPEKYIGKAIAIKAMERTDTGAYRHPRFIRLRLDKPASQCRLGEGL